MGKGLNASKEVIHKAGEFIGNKIGDVVTKPNDDKTGKQELVKEINIPSEKREEILKKLWRVLWKWNTIKYLRY